MTAVLIAGGRDFTDLEFILERFLRMHEKMGFTKVITGGARGVDKLAHAIAEELGIPTEVYMADWDRHGQQAGPLRNTRMLKEGNPDLLMAFPGGPGTENMIRQTLAARIPIWKSKQITFNSKTPKWSWLSNMAIGFEFVDEDGCIWMTSEHYYQSRKSDDEVVRAQVQAASNGFDAKQIGGRIKLIEGWNPQNEPYGGLKELAMQESLCYKFAEGSKAADLLLKTGEDYLVEYSPYGDLYWGTNGTNGLNRLGVLLMKQRDYLRGIFE